MLSHDKSQRGRIIYEIVFKFLFLIFALVIYEMRNEEALKSVKILRIHWYTAEFNEEEKLWFTCFSCRHNVRLHDCVKVDRNELQIRKNLHKGTGTKKLQFDRKNEKKKLKKKKN